MVIVRKHELGKYKIITGDGMFLSPYYKGEGMYLGRGYYKPKRQRGVGHQFRGDGIIDTEHWKGRLCTYVPMKITSWTDFL